MNAPAERAHLQPLAASGLRSFADYPTQALMRVAERPACVFTHGQGSWLSDSEGRRCLDWVQGWAVNTLGHAPAEVAAALSAQAARLLQAGPGFYNDRAIELAARLTEASGLGRCFVTTSGAEANEGAIKLARKYGQVQRGGAFEIITFADAFHGRTLATMSASGKAGFERLFEPKVTGFPKARLNDLASVQALIHARTVAVMLEPIQGEAGVIEAQPSFLQALRELCDAQGLLLILDEVQTGVGRTGRLWAHQWSGIQPDIMTLGKGLGGGVPIGAVLARESVCCFEPGDQGGTYTGHALMCAAALAVLDVVQAPGFLARVQTRSEQMRHGLQAFSSRLGGGPVRGRGLLLALDLPGDDTATRIAQAARERAVAGDAARPGLLLNPVRPASLRLVPALNLSEDDLAVGFQVLDETVR